MIIALWSDAGRTCAVRLVLCRAFYYRFVTHRHTTPDYANQLLHDRWPMLISQQGRRVLVERCVFVSPLRQTANLSDSSPPALPKAESKCQRFGSVTSSDKKTQSSYLATIDLERDQDDAHPGRRGQDAVAS